MDDIQGDLRGYYEEEARLGLRKQLRGRRVELRTEFLDMLAVEGRRAVVDFGAGPGFDGDAFREAGVSYLGLDLAHGNGVLAAERAIDVIQGSLSHPPLRLGSFDAGWSMSTLMHVPEVEVSAAVEAMADSLCPGAPLLVGQWGGDTGDWIDDQKLPGHRRLFSRRSFERNRELLAAAGSVEREEVWEVPSGDEEYHVVLVRLPAS